MARFEPGLHTLGATASIQRANRLSYLHPFSINSQEAEMGDWERHVRKGPHITLVDGSSVVYTLVKVSCSYTVEPTTITISSLCIIYIILLFSTKTLSFFKPFLVFSALNRWVKRYVIELVKVHEGDKVPHPDLDPQILCSWGCAQKLQPITRQMSMFLCSSRKVFKPIYHGGGEEKRMQRTFQLNPGL